MRKRNKGRDKRAQCLIMHPTQAGGKAAAKKMEDPGRDTNTEYNKEKIKEKVDNL
jgi:hypothetical protein